MKQPPSFSEISASIRFCSSFHAKDQIGESICIGAAYRRISRLGNRPCKHAVIDIL